MSELTIYNSLSPDQLKNMYRMLTGENIKVVMYDEIIEANDIESVFHNDNAIIIFYPYASHNNLTMGHFCCLTKLDDTYYYYDPLGYKPDFYKKSSPMRKKLYSEKENSLIRLLLNTKLENYNVDWNNHQHQSRSTKIATCGRHCVHRCVYANLSNDDYNKLLKQLQNLYKNPDGKSKLHDHLIMKITDVI